MNILHTSDWHLGRTLFGKKRTREFEAFLDWLSETLRTRKVDVLLVAGDVFDTTTPSNRTQQLYYRFLCHVADTGCRHAVVIGGNHDSPTFLDAPKELLRSLDIHVVGAAMENPEDELLTLRDAQGRPELFVCAVPYLRDRDVRSFEADEGVEDKGRKMLEGIREHYEKLGRLAEAERAENGRHIPVVATGHLFASGGRTAEGDGVRDLYVGTLVHVDPECFPSCIDYLALGHLHFPQKVGGSEIRRYSGSPLAMGPGEAGQARSVTLVTLPPEGGEPKIELIPVPVFQELERITGDLETIGGRIDELRLRGSSAWLEIVYEGREILPDLRERLEAMIAGSNLEILRAKNVRALRGFSEIPENCAMPDGPDVGQVFAYCLEARSVPDEQREELLEVYREVLASLEADDPGAE